MFWKKLIFIICWLYNTWLLCWIIMLKALLLRLSSQDVKGWLLRLMLLPCCFDLHQSKVLDVREPCDLLVLDVVEPYLFSFGSWCYWTLSLYYGSWCYRTMRYFRFRCYGTYDCWFRCYRTFMLVQMLRTYDCWWV